MQFRYPPDPVGYSIRRRRLLPLGPSDHRGTETHCRRRPLRRVFLFFSCFLFRKPISLNRRRRECGPRLHVDATDRGEKKNQKQNFSAGQNVTDTVSAVRLPFFRIRSPHIVFPLGIELCRRYNVGLEFFSYFFFIKSSIVVPTEECRFHWPRWRSRWFFFV